MADRILNAEPSPDDPLDFMFTGDTAAVLPRRYIVAGMGPVLDQGSSGTCSAHGATAVRQWQEKRDGHGVIPVDIFRFYDLVKIVVDQQPDPGRTRGTTIRSVMRLMKGTGVPLKGVAAPGAGGKIATYWRVLGPSPASVTTLVKQALMAHGPLLSRCDWDAAWMRLPIDRVIKPPTGKNVGGHIWTLIGWDDDIAGGAWIIRNSWGRWSIAGNGNCYIPRPYLGDKRPEFWACTDRVGD